MNDENKNTESLDTTENLLEISDKIKELKFKKKIFGGVDILDVWQKLSQIDKEYQETIKYQKIFYENQLRIKQQELDDLKTKISKESDFS